jgi:hypothetical protein
MGLTLASSRQKNATPSTPSATARKGAEAPLKNNKKKMMEKPVHQLKLNRLQICTLSTDELEVQSNVSTQLWLFLTVNVCLVKPGNCRARISTAVCFLMFALYTTTTAIPLQYFLFSPNTFHSLSDRN